MLRQALVTLITVALAASAHAATVYVANNGVDAPGCGFKKSPCRSIGKAVNFSAAAGDTVVVGPGTYGDLNGDGVLGDSAGEETGGFGCMVVIAQAVTLTSSNGASGTIIDARGLSIGCNVGIIADGARFGKSGKGFTVTDTKQTSGIGIELNAPNVAVSGNQVVGNQTDLTTAGIETVDNSNTAVITGNQVIRWGTGIRALGAGKTVSKNDVSQNELSGIYSNGPTVISGNVVTNNDLAGGIYLVGGAATVVGNAVYGNAFSGIFITDAFSGTIQKNNVFGNGACGLQNGSSGGSIKYPGVAGVVAANNYWGAATGPGPDPADPAGGTCDQNGGSTIVAPFATKPFGVKAPVKF